MDEKRGREIHKKNWGDGKRRSLHLAKQNTYAVKN